MSKRLLFTALASLALGGTAFAGDGRLEINQACVATGCFLGDSAGLPVETQPNQSYVLTSSLAIGSAVIGVTLGAGSALDLNGFTIEGDVSCTGAPAACSEAPFAGGGVVAGSRAVVRNGTIRKTRSNGVQASSLVRVENMVLEQNASGGVGASNAGAAGSLIQDCLIVQNGGNAGILVNNNQGSLGVRVLRNTIHGNQGMGVQGAVSLLTDNVITSNGNVGAALNYSGNTSGFGGNQLWNNNGGNANPQMSGGVSIGTNVCGTDTTCP